MKQNSHTIVQRALNGGKEPMTIDISEHDKQALDFLIFGNCITRDGKHIALDSQEGREIMEAMNERS